MSNENKRGSTLFICILSTAVLAFCGIFTQAAYYRMVESEIYRALSSQINRMFTVGGGGMTTRYGLTCLQPIEGKMKVYDLLTKNLQNVDPPEIMLYESVTDPEHLALAIGEYMRYRLPVILASQTVSRIQSISRAVTDPEPATDSFGLEGWSVDALTQSLGKWLMSFDFTEYLDPEPAASEEGEAGVDIESETDGLLDDLRMKIRSFLMDRILGEDLLQELQSLRSCLSRFMADQNLQGSSGFDFPKMLDPTEVSRFVSDMDDWFALDSDPLYQKCGYVEYVMGMCSRVMPPESTSRPSYADGLEGRDFAVLHQSEGPDVERILSGHLDAGKASSWTFSALTAIRFAICAVSNFADPVRCQKAKAAAAAISGVVALVSAGSVILPEAPLSVVVASVWSLAQAYDETDRLRKGESVALCPQWDPILLQYDDYLRLFLYLMPTQRIIQRLGQVLENNISGEFYLKVSIWARFHGRELRLTGRCLS